MARALPLHALYGYTAQRNIGRKKEIHMPPTKDEHLQDVAILTRAVENVFRKLIRFLVGRISLVKLQEMIRFIYVEEAEKNIRAENPGKNVPLARLALVTGLDTRTILHVKKKLALEGKIYKQQFLKDLTPESAIVEAWADQINLAVQGGAGSSVLTYGSENSEFENLVRSTISTRGITTHSIIQRLVATNSIEQDKSKKLLKLIVDQFSPYLSNDEPNIVNAAFSAISNLISTIEYNINVPNDQKIFQRQSWTFRLEPSDQLRFRKTMRHFLEKADKLACQIIRPWERDEYGEELITAGIGLYYFEDV
jgi:hypothetical protein